MKLVLATNNKDKIREIKNVLAGLPVEILTCDDFENFPDIEETGTTLEENAILKARGIAEFTGLPSMADDTGLEVDALNGEPGVYSARFAGPGCTYADNCTKLLKELNGVPEEKRGARFRTVIAIAWDKETIDTVDGSVDGIITIENKGTNGFGYDPVFFYEPAGMTFAEMSLEAKNKISHRGKAVLAAKELLEKKIG